ncbi:ubiquinol-cytochrome C reductase [Xylaria sp. FL1042]|nr:ubiquinol-cytochrome C reductase [Xylaria sp. FL1042]
MAFSQNPWNVQAALLCSAVYLPSLTKSSNSSTPARSINSPIALRKTAKLSIYITSLFYLLRIIATMSALYNALFRRNYQMLGFVFGAAFAFEMAYDTGMNKLWDSINRGRQWKDIRHRYVEEE